MRNWQGLRRIDAQPAEQDEGHYRSMAENSFERVNMTSVFYILLTLGAGLQQTILVRNLFKEPHKLHQVWRKAAQMPHDPRHI